MFPYERELKFVYTDFRPIEFDFAPKILMQLTVLKLFKSEHAFQHQCLHEDNFWSKSYIRNLAAKSNSLGLKTLHKISD